MSVTIPDSASPAESALSARHVNLTPQELLKLGLDQVAYIRAAEEGFNIHLADGEAVAHIDSMEEAQALIRYNNMAPVLLH